MNMFLKWLREILNLDQPYYRNTARSDINPWFVLKRRYELMKFTEYSDRQLLNQKGEFAYDSLEVLYTSTVNLLKGYTRNEAWNKSWLITTVQKKCIY